MQIPRQVQLALYDSKKMEEFNVFLAQSGVEIVEEGDILISNSLKFILEGIQQGKRVIAVDLYLPSKIMEQCNLMVRDLSSLMTLWSPKELILFDMDGLLVDTELLCLEPYRKAHESYGYSISDQLLQRLIGTSGKVMEKILRSNYDQNYPYEKVIHLADEYVLEEIRRNLPVKRGAHAILQYYQDQKISCIVASSSPRSTIELYIEKANFDGMFQKIICLDDVARSKPEPDIFLKGLEKMNAAPQNSLVFEDSRNGIIAAYLAGIPVVCVPDLIYHDEEIFRKTIAFGKSLDCFI